jgi:hypothetical protein
MKTDRRHPEFCVRAGGTSASGDMRLTSQSTRFDKTNTRATNAPAVITRKGCALLGKQCWETLIRTRNQEMDLRTTSPTGSLMIGTLVDGHGACCRPLPLNRHSFLMQREIKRQHPGSQQTVSLRRWAVHSRWLAPAHRAPYRHATRGRYHQDTTGGCYRSEGRTTPR